MITNVLVCVTLSVSAMIAKCRLVIRKYEKKISYFVCLRLFFFILGYWKKCWALLPYTRSLKFLYHNKYQSTNEVKLTKFSLSMRFCSRSLLSALWETRRRGELLAARVFFPVVLPGLGPGERRESCRRSRWFSRSMARTSSLVKE